MQVKKYILFLLFAAVTIHSYAQLTVSAGNDKTICPGANTIIGGSPTAGGGLPPYTYTWTPTTGLSASNVANPTASPSVNTTYTVTVKDDTGAVRADAMILTINVIANINAGRDTSICEGISASIGSSSNPSGIAYSWSPGTTLDDSTSTTPVSSPTVTTTYTLTATVAGCPPRTDNVKVIVIPTPPINAGMDTTIMEGAVAHLHASGGFFYAWGDGPTLTYIYNENADAEPTETTTYHLYGTDATNECPGYDDITVFVTASDQVVIYNTFTPNFDGNNDTWYIGNIYKYPDNTVEVYNRYGKQVYKAKSYLNNWDGKAYGEELPSGTYFYILDLGHGLGTFHGTVTIIK
ncbi:MAG: hypothetical protein JWP12_427 [Bacteroidetes bacterium]|nr:hypothetical protein [Bacteroidota bacterium]